MKKLIIPVMIGLLNMCSMSANAMSLADCKRSNCACRELVWALAASCGDGAMATVDGIRSSLGVAGGGALAADLRRVEYERDAAQRDLATAQADLATVRGEKDAAQRDLATAQADLVTVRGERDAAQRDLATVTGERDTAQADLIALQTALTDKGYLGDASNLDFSHSEAENARQIAIPLLEALTDDGCKHVRDFPSAIWAAAINSNIALSDLWGDIRNPASIISTASWSDDTALANLPSHISRDDLPNDDAMKFALLKVALLGGKNQTDIDGFSVNCSGSESIPLGAGGLELKVE